MGIENQAFYSTYEAPFLNVEDIKLTYRYISKFPLSAIYRSAGMFMYLFAYHHLLN